MVTDCNEIYCGEGFVVPYKYQIIILYIPETNIVLYIYMLYIY